jgi:hypothetical protein
MAAPVSKTNTVSKNVRALNPSTLGSFFSIYNINNGPKSLSTGPGHLQQASENNQPLYVSITHPLSPSQWAHFKNEADKLNVRIEFVEKVSVPFEQLKTEIFPQYLQVISSDIRYTAALIEKLCKEQSIQSTSLNITDCRPCDLFFKVNAAYNKEEKKFLFSKRPGFLNTPQCTTKKVFILYGALNEDTEHELAKLVVEKALPENLHLIWINTEPKSLLPSFCTHSFTTKDQLAFIKLAPEYHKFADNLSYSQLSVLKKVIKPDDSTNPIERWLNQLTHLTEEDKKPDPHIGKTALDQARLDKVLSVLAHFPFVLLSGVTGCGKTAFVQKVLSKKLNTYLGSEQLLEWVNIPTGGILFFDEANMHCHWHFLESLLNQEPCILIDGVVHKLTEKHKVIFTFNPSNYGNRIIPALFSAYPLMVTFQPLPFSYIDEVVFQPLFIAFNASDQHRHLFIEQVRAFFKAVSFLTTDKVLISPRELEMIALMFFMQKEKNALLLYKICDFIAKSSLSPQTYINLIKLYPELQNAKQTSFALPEKKSEGYTLMPSRAALLEPIRWVFNLKRYRKTEKGDHISEFGGIGGLILEGESGIGKSEFIRYVINILYLEQDTIYISAGTNKEHMITQLKQADEEEKIVVIDEISSADIPEELLLTLLTRGRMFLFASQNDCSSSGREPFSNALLRRLMIVRMPNYTSEEAEFICAQSQPLEVVQHAIRFFTSTKTVLNVRALQTAIEEASPYAFPLK